MEIKGINLENKEVKEARLSNSYIYRNYTKFSQIDKNIDDKIFYLDRYNERSYLSCFSENNEQNYMATITYNYDTNKVCLNVLDSKLDLIDSIVLDINLSKTERILSFYNIIYFKKDIILFKSKNSKYKSFFFRFKNNKLIFLYKAEDYISNFYIYTGRHWDDDLSYLIKNNIEITKDGKYLIIANYDNITIYRIDDNGLILKSSTNMDLYGNIAICGLRNINNENFFCIKTYPASNSICHILIYKILDNSIDNYYRITGGSMGNIFCSKNIDYISLSFSKTSNTTSYSTKYILKLNYNTQGYYINTALTTNSDEVSSSSNCFIEYNDYTYLIIRSSSYMYIYKEVNNVFSKENTYNCSKIDYFYRLFLDLNNDYFMYRGLNNTYYNTKYSNFYIFSKKELLENNTFNYTYLENKGYYAYNKYYLISLNYRNYDRIIRTYII